MQVGQLRELEHDHSSLRAKVINAWSSTPPNPPRLHRHAQVLLVTETDGVMVEILWSVDPAVSRGFDDHQAECNGEVIGACVGDELKM